MKNVQAKKEKEKEGEEKEGEEGEGEGETEEPKKKSWIFPILIVSVLGASTYAYLHFKKIKQEQEDLLVAQTMEKIMDETLDEEKKSEAVSLMVEMARRGNVKAMWEVSQFLLAGKFLPRNFVRAVELLEKLVDRKHAKAMVALAQLCQSGEGIPKNYIRAMELLKKAEKKGESVSTRAIIVQETLLTFFLYPKLKDAYVYHAMMFLEGVGVKQDLSSGVNLLELGIENNNPLAMFSLANFLLGRKSSKEEKERAHKLLERACEEGKEKMCSKVANVFLSINPKNVTKAIESLEKAGEYGDLQSFISLGSIYLEGKLVGKDVKKALSYMEKASERGHEEATQTLYSIYLSGKLVKKDLKKAAFFLERSANQGNTEAMVTLASLYLRGDIKRTQETISPFQWLERAAEKGDETAKKILSERNPQILKSSRLFRIK